MLPHFTIIYALEVIFIHFNLCGRKAQRHGSSQSSTTPFWYLAIFHNGVFIAWKSANSTNQGFSLGDAGC